MIKETIKKSRPPKDDPNANNSLAVWLRLQKSLAEKGGIALSTLSRDSAVIGRIENDNSICQAMRVSAEHAPLCAADCAAGHACAIEAGRPIEYVCHAGLHCFAVPVSIDDNNLVILGGRAFTSTAEYARFQHRYQDLDGVRTGECLKNIKFVPSHELRAATELVASSAEYHFQSAAASRRAADSEASPELLDAHLEIIRLTDQLENKKRSISRFYDFVRGAFSSLDSQKVYPAALAKLGEIMKSGRSSLLVLNDQSGELALEAAVGFDAEAAGPIRVKVGEGIAGSALALGTALVVRDVDAEAGLHFPRPGKYRTKSFISFPIALGPRKVGVVNLTDRLDGSPYESEDLSLLELMAPHLALIIDRTEWHRKAEAYQRMSLTDALTGLPNRRYLEDRLFAEVERCKRHETALSFMLIDVDRFKTYNDIYGHTNADRVLVRTAQILSRSVRAMDMPARFAGDEFCIILPETELAAAARIADRLRAAAGQAEYRSEQGELMGKVTLSIGVSSFSPTRQSPLAIIESADRALYQAKTRGRNCVAVYDDAFTARG